METLVTWLRDPDPETFPYAEVVAAIRSTGKHFVPDELLALLAAARTPTPAGGELRRFLDFVLDKHDGVYDNPSYIAVDLLPLPTPKDPEADRLFAALVADLLAHELGNPKRCRLALRALGPKLERLGLEVVPETGCPERAVAVVAAALTDRELHTLRTTMLPVSLVHDEHMFIRTLQAYETTFAAMAAHLQRAIGDPVHRAGSIAAAERVLREAKPLLSLVATMRPEQFLEFRQFTDGASAIQSRHYKLVEALCRRPDAERLDSPAFRSVPCVRARVLAGLPDLVTAIGAEPPADVRAAMASFEAVLLAWRRTHFRMAMRMLGARRGTGHTDGVPYLDSVRERPVFAH